MFETKRLQIRRFEETDGLDLFNYLSKPDVIEYEPCDTYTLEESVKEAKSRSKDDRFLAVVLKENYILIGNLYFNKSNNDFNTWEIGYVFNSDYHNLGYATESLLALLEYLFVERKAHRIIAYCSVLNQPSFRLLERVNFRREGCFIKQAYFKKDEAGNPKWFNTYAYGLLSEEYFK
ncbi:MAG: GNAT family N-acetyltransferase [Tenericutes bacterium]|nr:GNAT family N-acetyltransferase [Mycoplasmatota bacterium]